MKDGDEFQRWPVEEEEAWRTISRDWCTGEVLCASNGKKKEIAGTLSASL